MNRREILKAAASGVTVATIGLAGCNSSGSDGSDGDGGEGSNCDIPDGDLRDVFPGGDYTLTQDIQTVGPSSGEGQEREGRVFYASYEGPGERELQFQIAEYNSESLAAEETATVEEHGSEYTGSVGYIQTGAYIIAALAGDEAAVKRFMKASSLSDECVEANVVIV